ncbi:unnamed protein product [Cuscuta europaea]|uniref:Uncharacterized protein n=1 Tax=Cuscuta europaea TaxID=41803 RepID=A0A9P1E725_CUSEU|nr:unnamed protein product [Cuscuta europaea]
MLISLNPFDFLSPPSQFLSLPLSINLAIIATSSQHSWSHGNIFLSLFLFPHFFM